MQLCFVLGFFLGPAYGRIDMIADERKPDTFLNCREMRSDLMESISLAKCTGAVKTVTRA